MKKIHILTLLLAGASLFTACKKEDATTLSAPGAAYTSGDYNYTAAINYKLTIMPSDTRALFHWTDGYLHANSIILNDMHRNGTLITPEKFGAQIDQTVPLGATTTLGSIKTPTLKCDFAAFTIGIAQSGTTHALYLNGIYNSAVDMPPTPAIPVQMIIDEPVSMNSSSRLSNILINGTDNWANMQLNLMLLTNGIDATMMEGAVLDHGTILITKTSNVGLYNIIVSNLQNNMMVQLGIPVKNTGNPSAQ